MPSAEPRIVSAWRELRATPDEIFELIADPTRQPEWDGNNNLSYAGLGQRVRSVGDVLVVTLTQGSVRENHVVEFVEGRRIAWMPAEPGARLLPKDEKARPEPGLVSREDRGE